MSRILSVVITYYPDKKLLQDNINAFINYVDAILIWENTPIAESAKYRYVNNQKVIFYGVNENKGISFALNYAWKYAKANGYDYLLTMDQDSKIENFQLFINQVLSMNEIAIYGIPPMNSIKEKIFRVSHTITSGTLIPIQILNDINGYRENFFVDAIDVDLSYRARRYGYNTYWIGGTCIKQVFGNQFYKKIGGAKFLCFNYGPKRLYGILRNHIIIEKEYKTELSDKKLLYKIYILKFLINILFFEPNKIKKIKAMVLGIYDGILNKDSRINYIKP